jgi:S-adenosylmethionine decarboxylase
MEGRVMANANLLRPGMDLETGTPHDTRSHGAARPAAVRDLLDGGREDHFIRRGDKVFAGTHLIIEVVAGHGLDDAGRIERAFRDCVAACGATLLHIHTHKFAPQGVSGVAVLAESHISVHTWPEIGYGAFDVFMCGDADPWRAVEVLRRAFDAREVRVRELLRGEGLVAGPGA